MIRKFLIYIIFLILIQIFTGCANNNKNKMTSVKIQEPDVKYILQD
ncbi:PBP1b-binding outer membrane lipoprotein LpoB [Fusobacterium sp. PH5-44]